MPALLHVLQGLMLGPSLLGGNLLGSLGLEGLRGAELSARREEEGKKQPWRDGYSSESWGGFAEERYVSFKDSGPYFCLWLSMMCFLKLVVSMASSYMLKRIVLYSQAQM